MGIGDSSFRRNVGLGQGFLYLIVAVTLSLTVQGCSSEGKGGKNQNFPVTSVSKKDGKEMLLVPAGEFLMGTDKVDTEDTHLKIGTVKPLFLDQKPKQKIH